MIVGFTVIVAGLFSVPSVAADAAEPTCSVGWGPYMGDRAGGDAGVYGGEPHHEPGYVGVYAYNNSTGATGFGLWAGVRLTCIDT
jgi:hypothetical protein